MPPQDEAFIKRLRATFQVEAEEHLQVIAAKLLLLEKSASASEREAAIENIYREAHSLKGAARAVDLADIETICQAMESIFSQWKQQPITLSPNILDVLHTALDVIRKLLGSTATSGGTMLARDTLLSQLASLGASGGLHGAPSPALAASMEKKTPVPALTAPPENERASAETVRISIAKLDAQLLRAEELLSFKAIAARHAGEFRELSLMLEKWQTQWARLSSETRAVRQAREPAGASSTQTDVPRELLNFVEANNDFHRSLEIKLRSLAAQAQRDRYSVAKRLDELLEDSKKLLMLPFSSVAITFPKVVRDLCRELGKEAELVIQGGDVEVDKRILEEMKDAFIHILRNSVDHGIEAPGERAARHKRAEGTIRIAVSQVNGSKVEILVSDDGQGVEVEAVKAAAVRRGVLSSADAAALSERDGLALAFHSEVSTCRAVTAVSGRGLGMAIVRSKVEKLGGQISLESKRFGGTTLRILLPQTLATFRGILVTAADQTFVIPAPNVERVMRLRPADIVAVENRETISVEGRVVSLARLEAVLGLPDPTRQRDSAATIFAVILQAGGERIAFAVDEILHEEEVLVKPLRKPLVRVRNIGGATILGSGKVVPTLNINDLMKSARVIRSPAAVAKAANVPEATAKRILVVEDSITSRMLLKGILESAGYDVETAVDGMDAYTQLRESVFDAVVSDVEMPRLNGFDLTAKIRADQRLAELPVVLVTALESRQQRERGVEAGANAYIVKSSFDQSNLLEVIRRLL